MHCGVARKLFMSVSVSEKQKPCTLEIEPRKVGWTFVHIFMRIMIVFAVCVAQPPRAARGNLKSHRKKHTNENDRCTVFLTPLYFVYFCVQIFTCTILLIVIAILINGNNDNNSYYNSSMRTFMED